MNTVTVDKNQLLETLLTNRDKHEQIFDKAQAEYRRQMIAELDLALSDAKAGRKIKRAFSLPVPENHTEDFDTAIGMLQWEVNDTVELEQNDFEQYVLNKWRWASSFAANTQSYLAT